MFFPSLGTALASTFVAVVGLVGCASTPPVAFEGHRWTVVRAIDIAGGRDLVLHGGRAWVAFDGHGTLTAYDLVEHKRIHYKLTASGFEPTGPFKGSFGWYVSKRDEAIAIIITDVVEDHWHPVEVRSLGNDRIELTSFWDHNGDKHWRPTYRLVCALSNS